MAPWERLAALGAAGWLRLAGGGRGQLGFGQLLRSPGNRSAETVLAEVVRRLLIVAAVTMTVYHPVDRLTIGLGGNAGCTIGQQLHIACQHQRYRLVHTSAALRQLLVCLGDNLLHSLTPCGPATEVKSGNLFPGECRNCYHDNDLHLTGWWLLYLAVGESRAPQRPLCFNMTCACFALRLAASSP